MKAQSSSLALITAVAAAMSCALFLFLKPHQILLNPADVFHSALPGLDHSFGSLLTLYERFAPGQSPDYTIGLTLPQNAIVPEDLVPRLEIRVLFVVGELDGLHKNGGIGTAYRGKLPSQLLQYTA